MIDHPKEFLIDTANTLPKPYKQLCLDVAEDEYFNQTPGGATHHHAWAGGLVEHTAEVVSYVNMLSQGLDDIARAEVITAAFWHDYAKVFEYKVVVKDGVGVVENLPYRNLIGHVVGSYIEFLKAANRNGLVNLASQERIGHIMLAHHGRLEWRSPVEPQTVGAHILHAADMLSARK